MPRTVKIKVTTLLVLLAALLSALLDGTLLSLLNADMTAFFRNSTVNNYLSNLSTCANSLEYALASQENLARLLVADRALQEDVLAYKAQGRTVYPRIERWNAVYARLLPYAGARGGAQGLTVVAENGLWSFGENILINLTPDQLASLLGFSMAELTAAPRLIYTDREIPYCLTRSIPAKSLYFACAMPGPEGSPAALVLVNIDANALNAAATRSAQYALLLGRDVVSATPGFDRENLAGLEEQLFTHETGYVQRDAGHARVYYKRLAPGGLMLAFQENMVLSREYDRLSMRYLCLSLAVCLVTALLLSLLLVRRAMRPITLLVAQSKAYCAQEGEGEPPPPAPPLHSANLRRRVVIVLLTSVSLSMALCFVLYAVTFAPIVRREVTAAAEESHLAAEESVALRLRGCADMLQMVGCDPSFQRALLQRDNAAILERLRHYCRLWGIREELQVYDVQDQLLTDTDALLFENTLPALGGPVPGYGLSWGGLHTDASGRQSFLIAYAVRALPGALGATDSRIRTIGRIACVIDERELSRAYRGADEALEGERYLSDARGTVVSGSSKAALGAPLDALLAQAGGNAISTLPVTGTPLSLTFSTPWENPEKQITGVLYGRFWLLALAVSLLVLAAEALAGLVLRPMARIKQLLDRREYLTLESLYAQDSFIAEADELGRSFNEMKQRIDQLVDDLIRARLRETALEKRKRDAELYSLQSQIKPHFVCNLLESVRSLVALQDYDGVNRMLHNMGDLFRYSLSNASVMVPLREEIAYSKAYANIMQQRYHDRIQVHWSVDGALNELLVPRLLLQPLIENAIEHGLAPLDGGNVWVRVSAAHGKLCLVVEDDGVGMPADTQGGRGIGMQNVRERIRFYFGDESTLRVDEHRLKGFCAMVEAPLSAAQDQKTEEQRKDSNDEPNHGFRPDPRNG